MIYLLIRFSNFGFNDSLDDSDDHLHGIYGPMYGSKEIRHVATFFDIIGQHFML